MNKGIKFHAMSEEETPATVCPPVPPRPATKRMSETNLFYIVPNNDTKQISIGLVGAESTLLLDKEKALILTGIIQECIQKW